MSKEFEINQQIYDKDNGQIVLYQRADHKNPKWQCRIKINGSTGYVRKSTKTIDNFEARRYAENLYDSLAFKFHTTGSTKTKTFNQVVDEFLNILAKQNKNAATIIEFRNRLYNYPVVFWNNIYIDTLKKSDLQKFITWRKSNGKRKTPALATIKKDLVPLRQVFKFAYEQEYIKELLIFENIRTKNKRRPTFTAKEWDTIREKLTLHCLQANNDRSKRYRTYLKYYVFLMGNSGMRPGEVRSLTWKCLDFRDNGAGKLQLLILIPSGKNNDRWVVPHKIVIDYLNKLKKFRKEELIKLKEEFCENEPIFCHSNGKPINTFKKGFKLFLEEYGLLRDAANMSRTIYSLRHTYATLLIEQGISHWNLAQNMGTSVEELEKHYVHNNPSHYSDEFSKEDIPNETFPWDYLIPDE